MEPFSVFSSESQTRFERLRKARMADEWSLRALARLYFHSNSIFTKIYHSNVSPLKFHFFFSMGPSKDSLPFDRSIHFLTLLSFPFFVYLEKKTLIHSRSERYRTVYGNENPRYEDTLHFHGLSQTFYVFQLIDEFFFSFRFFVYLKKKTLTYVTRGCYSDTELFMNMRILDASTFYFFTLLR